MENFFEVISQLTPLSPDSKAALSKVLRKLELPKGYKLLKQNSICNYVYLIEKGLTRTHYEKGGKDVTDWFSSENMFASSVVSFINRQPDRRGIELLEDSVIWALSHADLEKCCNKFHDIERFGRLLAYSGITLLQKRHDDLHFATALERYQTLMHTNPTIINRAPMGTIASFLGVTPETLSRIRAQI